MKIEIKINENLLLRIAVEFSKFHHSFFLFELVLRLRRDSTAIDLNFFRVKFLEKLLEKSLNSSNSIYEEKTREEKNLKMICTCKICI